MGNDGLQVSDKVRMLMDRMMTSNHVNVVGEGYTPLFLTFLGFIYALYDKMKLGQIKGRKCFLFHLFLKVVLFLNFYLYIF